LQSLDTERNGEDVPQTRGLGHETQLQLKSLDW
jgi:hypothetical protein